MRYGVKIPFYLNWCPAPGQAFGGGGRWDQQNSLRTGAFWPPGLPLKARHFGWHNPFLSRSGPVPITAFPKQCWKQPQRAALCLGSEWCAGGSNWKRKTSESTSHRQWEGLWLRKLPSPLGSAEDNGRVWQRGGERGLAGGPCPSLAEQNCCRGTEPEGAEALRAAPHWWGVSTGGLSQLCWPQVCRTFSASGWAAAQPKACPFTERQMRKPI